jgi:hypothetical protein
MGSWQVWQARGAPETLYPTADWSLGCSYLVFSATSCFSAEEASWTSE